MSYDLSMCDGKTIATIEILHPGEDQVDKQTVKMVFTDGHQLVLQANPVSGHSTDADTTEGEPEPIQTTFSVACTIAPVYKPDAIGYAVPRVVQ